jgi:allantoin racemase
VSRRTIMVVNPNTTVSMTDTVVAASRAVAAATTTVVGGTPARGVSAVESNLDEVWGAVCVTEQVAAGEQAGVDGYVIACFGDTGLAAARELARGPVVGMSEAALYAAAVAARFTIVTMPPRTREQSQRVLRHAGLEHRCTIRAIDEPVAAAASGSLHLLDEVAAQARAALHEDGAEAIVLGCAGLSDLLKPLHDLLGVPVIDGVLAGVTMVEGLLAMGLTTSRRATFATPERLGPR